MVCFFAACSVQSVFTAWSHQMTPCESTTILSPPNLSHPTKKCDVLAICMHYSMSFRLGQGTNDFLLKTKPSKPLLRVDPGQQSIDALKTYFCSGSAICVTRSHVSSDAPVPLHGNRWHCFQKKNHHIIHKARRCTKIAENQQCCQLSCGWHAQFRAHCLGDRNLCC